VFAEPVQLLLGCILLLSSLGIILFRNPVHACLSFLLTLLTLAALYLQLSAQFIAVMQILVYAGAILVIFMFVIVLFQDAYQQILSNPAESASSLLCIAASALVLSLIFLGKRFLNLAPSQARISEDYGTVESLGKLLYVDFFFPFEAVILLFLIAVVGALYVGKKGA
jgi:NADH-quinone oxidoreductase subunit J